MRAFCGKVMIFHSSICVIGWLLVSHVVACDVDVDVVGASFRLMVCKG